MTPHSSTLAWKIPWMEEPGLQSMGLLRVGHDSVTSLSRVGEGNGNPLQCSCLENPRDGGAWWAAIYGVAQSRTRLKRLSSSSSSDYMLYPKKTIILKDTRTPMVTAALFPTLPPFLSAPLLTHSHKLSIWVNPSVPVKQILP